MTQDVEAKSVVANGTSLYYEREGTGPAVLFIAGSTGDAGNFSRAAALLADEFSVVTYDRRGNSRSPRPSGWTTTSVGEQADDAAALINALKLAPVIVFGASVGGLIALDLIIRYPQLVRACILQEPSIFFVLPDPTAELSARRTIFSEALRLDGPRAAVKALMRYLNDDAVFSSIPANILERMLSNADTIISIEVPGFAGWRLEIERFGEAEDSNYLARRYRHAAYLQGSDGVACKTNPCATDNGPGPPWLLLLPPARPRECSPSDPQRIAVICRQFAPIISPARGARYGRRNCR